jgi:hypothetical protein
MPSCKNSTLAPTSPGLLAWCAKHRSKLSIMEILYQSVADEPNQRQVPHALPRSSHLRKRRHKLRRECRTMHRARSSAHVGARQRSTTSISAHKRESIERPLVPFPRLDLCPTAASEKSRQRIRLHAGCQKPNYGRPRPDTGKIRRPARRSGLSQRRAAPAQRGCGGAPERRRILPPVVGRF